MALKVISQTPPQTSQERTTESGDIKQLSKQLMEMQGVYDAAIKKVCEKL